MKRLKLFFACLLMAVLSIGQVWAENVNVSFASWTTSVSAYSATEWTDNGCTFTYANNNNKGWAYVRCGGKGATASSTIQYNSQVGISVESVVLNTSQGIANGSSSSITVTGVEVAAYSDDAFTTLVSSKDLGTLEYTKTNCPTSITVTPTTAWAKDLYYKITISWTATGTKNCGLNVSGITFNEYEETPSPSVSVDPASWNFGTVHASDAASKVFSVSGNNLTAGDLTLTVPTGFSVSPSSIAVDGTLDATEVTVSKNTSAENDYAGNLEITGGGLTSAKTVALTMTVDADPAPTGTFKLFSGDLSEGDYVFVVGGKAMTNTVSSNRLANTDVTISGDNKITNPDEAIIWHVAESGSHWTIYNNAIAKYVAATGTKNQAAVTDTEDDKILWSVEESSGNYNFNNKYNSELSTPVNSKLQRNGDYGWACYAAYSDIQLFKLDDGTPSAPIFSPAAGSFLEAQSVTLSAEAGAEIYYTMGENPADPTSGSTHYTGAIAVSSTTTIKAIAIKDEKSSGVATATYTIVATEHAGTELDPYSVADAKIVIDAIGTKENAYVSGKICTIQTTSLPAEGYITFFISADGTTAGQQVEAYKCKALNGEAFSALSDVETGATVVITGTLKKYNSTYELDADCHLVSYVAPTAPKQSIANDQDHPYTVAEALVYAADGVTYDLDDFVYVQGVVYDVASFNNGAMNIFIKDADAENSFELYKCAGINDGSATTPFEALTDVQAGDIVIGYGQLTVFNSVSEFKQGNYLVDLDRPTVAVTGVELNKESTSLEVGETETLVATIAPENATNKAVTWASGDETVATVENGVVTAVAEGTATITVTTVDGSFTDDCEVTVTAADPTKHVVTFDATVDKTTENTELSITKSNVTIAITSGDGRFNNSTDYREYKNSEFTVSCSAGNITKIEFTCASGYTVSGFADAEGLDKTNSVWTGNAESVSFTASNAQVRATEITVTYKEDNRAAAGLTWSTDAVELTVGDDFTAPTLNNPNSIAAGEITIASDNTDLAIVTAGVVSLVADATGTATITATFEGNEDYKPAVVSYTITVNEAGLDNVTFDSSEDHAESGETTITKGGFTLSFTSGSMDGTQAEYRLYKSQTMTLSSTDYLIKKIEFTCTSGNPITGFADATGLDKDNNEWTGESNTVELTASNAQVRMTKIKVFYVEDTRAAAGLAWDPADDIELTVGDALSAPALQNPNSIDAAEITIASSNTDLATVSEGVVSLVADATGSTTITATFAGNATYKPATVSYKITVNPAHSIYVEPSLYVNFGSVTKDEVVADKKITVTLTGVDAATLTLAGDGASAFTISPAAALTASGDITISASSENVGTFAATLTISDDAGNATSKVVNLSITVNEPSDEETPVSTSSKWVPATEVVDGMQVLITGVKDEVVYAMGAQASNGTGNNRLAVAGTLEEEVFTPGEGTMAFTLVDQLDGTYAIRTSNGKYLYAAASNANQLKTQDEVNENAKWTMTVASAEAEGSSNRHIMRFNTGSVIFSCYASGQTAIALYVEQSPEPPTPTADYTRDVTSGNYGTICLPKAGTIEGASIFEIAYYGEASKTIFVDEITSGHMSAGVPYIFQASAAQLKVYYDDNTAADVAAGEANGLHGFYNLLNMATDDADQLDLEQDQGNYILYNNQYWLVSGRAAYINNFRAYIKLDEISPKEPALAPGRRRVAMAVNGENAATGFENIESGDKPMKVMIEGTMYILRGEKVYDATGRLVK